MKNNYAKYGIILLSVFIISLGSTLAYYSWTSPGITNIAFDVITDSDNSCGTVTYDAGAHIEGANLYPTDDKEDGIKKEITISVDKETETAAINLYLDLKDFPGELLHSSFKYALYEGETLITSGNFLDSTTSECNINDNVNHILILEGQSPTTTETTLTLYIWIDGTEGQNPDSMMNQEFELTLHADGVCLFGHTDESGANKPNLVDGMLPIYYDESDGNWHKADKTNTDYNWYDYANRKWANMVLLNSDDARSTYNLADIGTTVAMDDIAAFYVWIPRYKYRVWNISRQACGSTNTTTCEAEYSYPAFSTGIDIEFEKGTATTGNVKCTYNPRNTADPTTLSDTCIYDKNDTITTTSDSSTYTDAWYTHPAFTFGDQELTGFWVGKFETTGTSTDPEIKPNEKALTSQKISDQFTTSQRFKSTINYGISTSNLDAHMLKNLEWGAISYLSYSDYGMCNETGCTGMYVNNAYSTTSTIGITTGRSGGAIAGNTETVSAHYPDSGSTATYRYFDYGYYTYDGKIVNYDGTYTEYASDRTLGTNASTTGNIYGIYDMNGGSNEYVMAVSYSEPTGTYVGPIGVSSSGFDGVNQSGTTLYSSGNSLLATVTSSSIALNTSNLKYFDTYSYGTSGDARTAWNRSRLGDATGEIVSGTSASYAWKPGSGVSGSYPYFVYSGLAWFSRGGNFRGDNSGPLDFFCLYGTASANYSFRSSLS